MKLLALFYLAFFSLQVFSTGANQGRNRNISPDRSTASINASKLEFEELASSFPVSANGLYRFQVDGNSCYLAIQEYKVKSISCVNN